VGKKKHVKVQAQKDEAQKPAGEPPKIPGKHPGGRPSKLTPALALKIFNLARLGATDQQIADTLDLTRQTISNWKTSKEFFDSLKAAKDDVDDMVERSLLQRGLGYNIEEEKLFVINDKITSKTVLKHIVADTTAALAWLHNRRPDKWRQKIPELSNLADSIGNVLQELRKYAEKRPSKSDLKGK